MPRPRRMPLRHWKAFCSKPPGQIRESCRLALTKDRDALLVLTTSLPSTGSILRTTNPIEKHLCDRPAPHIAQKGCLSNKDALAMVFKLVEGAQKNWRRIDGHNQLPSPKLIQGTGSLTGLRGHRPYSAAGLKPSAALILRPSPKIRAIAPQRLIDGSLLQDMPASVRP